MLSHPNRDQQKADQGFKLVYGVAHGGKSLFWHAGELLFAYFLTEACGTSPRQMGLILGGSMVVSALADLVVGVVLSRRVGSPRDVVAVQFWGTLVSAASFSAFAFTGFSPEGPPRFALALIALLVFRLSYALVDNPQNAILTLATRTDTERAGLSSIRYIFGSLANIAVALAFVPLFGIGGAMTHAASFTLFAVSVSLIALTTSAALWRYPRPPVGEAAIMLKAKVANTPNRLRLWLILAVMFLISAAMSVFSRLEPYFAAYGASTRLQGGAILTSIALGTLISQPLWSAMARRTTLSDIFRAGCLSMLLGSLAFDVLAPQGFAPSVVGSAVYGVGSGGVLMSLWALAAGSGDDDHATAVFGALTCVSKLALAFSAFAIAEVLSGVPYRSPEAARHWILPIMTAAPAAASLVALAMSLAFSRGDGSGVKGRPATGHLHIPPGGGRRTNP